MLGYNSDWWNAALLIALAFTAIAAVAVVATTFAVISAQKHEALIAKEEFARYKASVAVQVAEAKKEGIEAGRAAGGAEIRAAEANKGAAEANERAAEARKRAAEAEARAATANERAEALEKEASTAQLEQERLKATLAWRVLPPKEAEALQSALASHSGSVNLWYTDGDPEALFFGIQFGQIFINAHWKVSFASANLNNAIVFGVAAPDAEGDDALALRTALLNANIPFSTNAIPPMGFSFGGGKINGAPILMIGSRRPALFPKLGSDPAQEIKLPKK